MASTSADSSEASAVDIPLHPNQPPALRQAREAYQIQLLRPSNQGVSFKEGEVSDSSRPAEFDDAPPQHAPQPPDEPDSPEVAPIFSGKLLKRSGWLHEFQERQVTVNNGGGVRPPTLSWTGGKARALA